MSAAPPAAEEPADLQRRFGGLARLYGAAGAQRIQAAHVAVVGIGGVGSWAAEALARSAVGSITLIDLDHVAESNVNRQIHALSGTLGQAKVQAMRARIEQIHPGCVVHAVEDFVTADNWPQVLPEPVDAVIDACDQVAAKVAIAAWAVRQRKCLISVGAAGGKRAGERVEVADIAQVTHDPLIAQLRYRLRRHHGAGAVGKPLGVMAVFSRENVALPEACDTAAEIDGSLSCHGYGSSVAVTATFGFCAAGWILNQIARGDPKTTL